ncbi:MAG: acetyl ornithine aminotransferase family protein [Thermoproteota archaeon]|jgi:4-aminobutyrate aminotransferase|nr:acetyl ornithine aminotransferase family protein [Thermoproteota archaeon]
MNEDLPKIVITPPGPKALELLKEDEKYVSPSYARFYPLFVDRVEGTKVIDVDGNEYIDFNSGLLCLNIGRHPEVVKAIQRQANKLLHYSITDFYYKEVIELSKTVSEILPFKEAKFHFGNSGTEANEAALKLVRYYTGRPYILSFIGSFHGRTYGSMSLTASKPVHRRRFGPLLPGIVHAPYAYCYRCPLGMSYPDCGIACVDFIKEWILEKYIPPDEVAAFFFEPVQGEGGFVWPPPDYFKKLKRLADEYGILMVDDEVQAGIGRTGEWLAINHFDIKPDIITLAKAIASGLPLGLMAARAEIMNWEKGAHATTFGGNPVACAAAVATINVIKREKLLERVKIIGEKLLKRFEEMKDEYELIGDVRGKGFMIGIELVKNKKTKEYAVKEAHELIVRCWKRGLLLITAGRSVIRIAPPLNLEEKYIDKGLEIFEDEIKKIVHEIY